MKDLADKPVIEIEYKKTPYFWGIQIIRAREKLGLSQEALAKKLGCTQQTISHLENPIAHQLTSEREELLRPLFAFEDKIIS